MFHQGNRELQAHFDSERLADKLAERAAERSVRIRDDDRAFIESRDMFFLATADAEGRPNCSYKGGDPGFVRVVDDQTIAFPSYDGNGMYLSAGNTLVNPHVGLLFIDFGGDVGGDAGSGGSDSGRRLRLNGEATIDLADPLLAEYPGAEMIVRVRAREIFANCPRYIHRYRLVERSVYVPHADETPPEPEWKRSDWAREALPKRRP
ncbi:MAG: pyridoxamine 5'-phosphate oxidase family protein [Chloroflexi bacterium]|nr:pyridoxamine 5'-phosphate oxidase family protein [Chloroflexota bacterium]